MAQSRRDYGEATSRRGLVLSIGRIPDPVPLEPADIVWPDGWQLDADGRGLTMIEMQPDYDVTADIVTDDAALVAYLERNH